MKHVCTQIAHTCVLLAKNAYACGKRSTPGRGRRYQNTLFIDWSGKVSKGQKVCFRLNNITSHILTEPDQLQIDTESTQLFKSFTG